MALSSISRLALGFLAAGCCLPAPALGAFPVVGAPGIRVLSAAEVLSTHTEYDGTGSLYFLEPNGTRVRLITSTADPEILNPGAGQFFPAEVSEVEAALTALPHDFLRDLRVDVYVLPYPRSGQLASSATEGAIFLSPGVRALSPRQVHYLLAHEVGHAVHRRYQPDSDPAAWSRYAALRGIADSAIFHDGAAHAYRPHEIFAEDFRVLFGDALAAGDGSVENRALLPPEEVVGLRRYLLALVQSEAESAEGGPRVAPNPVRLGGSVSMLGLGGDLPADGSRVELVNAEGRRIVTLPVESGDGAARRFDIPKSGESGSTLPAGAYWFRWVDRRGRSTSVSIRILR